MTLADDLKRLSPSLYRLRIFVIIVAVLVLPFLIYYFFYVRGQSGYFTDRNFRKLSLISSQIALKLESTGSVLKNSSEKFIRPQVTEAESARFDRDPTQKKQNLERLKEAFKRFSGSQFTPVNIDTEPWSDKVAPGTVTLTAVRHEGDSSWLYFDYVSEGLSDKTVIRIQAKTDLNKLIQPFLSTRVGSDTDQFQNILITEADNARVIYQYDTSQVRLESLDKLPSVENQGKKIDIKDIVPGSNVMDVSLAGSNYRVFSNPVKLSLPSCNANAPNPTWITSGLIKSNYLRTQAWSISIPYTILIIGGFVVAMLVFSWPFLKLVLAGPKDRFRPKDVYFLVFATTVFLAVLTCFGLYAYVYTSVESQMDDQVASLASDIKKHFKDELMQALTQLRTLSENGELFKRLESEEKQRKAEAEAKSKATASSNAAHASAAANVYGTKDTNPAADIYNRDGTNKTDILPSLLTSEDTKYLYFDSAAWIDPGGMQRAKWTTKRYTTQYISVSGRAYFENVRKGNLYELGDHRFWLEPVISRTTGRNAVEISKPIFDTKWTLASDTRLLSLMDPVLPAGFGYVIIANDGGVLFHSDEAQHLGENLFQECDEDPHLRSATMGRGDTALNAFYLGEEHRFFITTLEGFPDWSLVVFRNKEPLRSAFFELLTSVTVLILIYGVVLMAGFTLFYVFNVVNERRAWLWPSAKKTAIYIQSILLLFGLSLISLVLIIVLHGQQLVWLIGGIGLFSGLLYFLNLRWGLSSPFLKYVPGLLDRFKRFDRAYVLNVMLLLLLVAILPASSFFKYAYESEIKLFVKHAQFSIATALEKRTDRIRSQYSNIKVTKDAGSASETEARRKEFIERRLAESWDVYDKFFFQTEHAVPSEPISCTPASEADLLPKLNTFLPLSNRFSIERRGLLDNASVAGLCKWESAGIEKSVLHLEGDAGQGARQLLHLNTTIPLLGTPGFAAIGIVPFLLPLFLFVNFIVRKVFLLDAQKPASHSLKKLLSEKIDRNAFVIVNAPFVKKEPAQGSNLHLRDLPSIAATSNWADTFDFNEGGDEGAIALDQFDYRIDDPQINLQKLKLVQNLLEKQRTLLIFSSADSSQYRFSNGGNGHANGERDEAGNWAGLIISNFFIEYAEDTDDGSSFKEKVDQVKDWFLAHGSPERSQKEIDELFDTLYVECAPREPLQRVGLQLLSQRAFIKLNREELIERIASQGRTYYTHLWNSCSPGERQTLCHLAQDRLLSHRDPDIEPLLRRELIVRDQDLHLFNQSFRQFVDSAERVSFVVEQDKQTQQGSLWQTLKVPIMVAMLAITAFLFITQQDLFSSSLALVTGITTLIPALFKVMTMFHSDPVGRPPG
jgi:hypothetical protein